MKLRILQMYKKSNQWHATIKVSELNERETHIRCTKTNGWFQFNPPAPVSIAKKIEILMNKEIKKREPKLTPLQTILSFFGQ